MPRYQYQKPGHRLDGLLAELLAAGITPERVEGFDPDVWVTVPESLQATVAAVVQAHNPAVYEAREAAAREQRTADEAALDALLAKASPNTAEIATAFKALAPLLGA